MVPVNVGLMILDIRTISREVRIIYLKKTRNDVVGLHPLTQDSLEMLQTRNGESRQKGGRKGKGDRTLETKKRGRRIDGDTENTNTRI